MIKKILKYGLRIIDRKIQYLLTILEIGNKNKKIMDYTDCYVTISKFLKYHKPIILYDIGANEGTWSYVMYKLNPDIKNIIFFEPQKKYCNILKKNSFLPDVDKTIYNIALGDENKITQIKGGSASASILNTKEQNNFFPNSLNDDSEETTIKKLDDIFLSDNLPIPDTVKIDVQGYELFALKGAEKMLKKIKYLIIELSFRDFYEGQPKLSEIINFLEKNNYIFVDFGYEWRDTKTNEVIQIDAFLLNNNYEK